MKAMKSKQIKVADQLSVRFTMTDQGLGAGWSSKCPPNTLSIKQQNRYVEGRNLFLADVAKATGKSIAITDLSGKVSMAMPDGTIISNKDLAKAGVTL